MPPPSSFQFKMLSILLKHLNLSEEELIGIEDDIMKNQNPQERINQVINFAQQSVLSLPSQRASAIIEHAQQAVFPHTNLFSNLNIPNANIHPSIMNLAGNLLQGREERLADQANRERQLKRVAYFARDYATLKQQAKRKYEEEMMINENKRKLKEEEKDDSEVQEAKKQSLQPPPRREDDDDQDGGGRIPPSNARQFVSTTTQPKRLF